MPSNCGMYYKSCREMAGYTQENASWELHISVRSLAAYETDERTPDDGLVESMTRLYKTPLLAYIHLKKTSQLGKYLPDVQLPASVGDMGFQTVLSHVDAEHAESMAKAILADGMIDPSEYGDLRKLRNIVSIAADRFLSVRVYVDTLLQDKEGSE